ncbi:MAG: monovalent cation/H+ antiporter subunit D [Paracoccus denitrificans]|nr:MAG: monovalent cation/H+ antiporter subunit D [Paracoccus denitrificans]PZO83202.1 MAG: monovalent cation/H+ antiporter subunit D [Paracoccus denitrificans]
MITPVHMIVAPILIPLVAGAIMLLYDERQRQLKLGIGIASCVLQIIVASILILRAGASDTEAVSLYLLGDWASPFGIVLVLDRLSAVMLLLGSLVALPALIYSGAVWHKNGQHFAPLFQFMLMGVNGAFLTGDLFNLFVFFEVTLAASYGLMLHGSGRERVGAGMHYIAVNLLAAMMFLLGVALIYGVVGTLNMADLATRIGRLSEADRPLIHAAAAILAGAFLVKAAMWPLCFWLPSTYSAAAPPVAALFAILTKVGVYVVIRLGLLLFGHDTGLSAAFGADVLVIGGLATIFFGMVGILASQNLQRMASNLVMVSSGTVLTVIGFAMTDGNTALLSSALYYMFASTLAISGLFLLVEPIERKEGGIAGVLAVTAEAYGIEMDEEENEAETGVVIPGATTILGISFMAFVIVASGLPPLAGFVGKFGMMAGAVSMTEGNHLWAPWLFVGLLVVSGFATLVAMVRWGIQSLWANDDEPPLSMMEILALLMLVASLVFLTVKAEPAMRYLQKTAVGLTHSGVYIGKVMTAPSVGGNGQ